MSHQSTCSLPGGSIENKLLTDRDRPIYESKHTTSTINDSFDEMESNSREGRMQGETGAADAAADVAKVSSKRSAPYVKLTLAVLLLGAIAFVIVDFLTTKHIESSFQTFLNWISDNLLAGVFAFIFVYFVATVAFIPGSILTLGSGFVFGKAVGLGGGVVLASAAVFVGASLGSLASFFLGRYLLRDTIGKRLVEKYPVIKALDDALEQKGFQIFVLLRLSPVIPFNAINYIAGVTAITTRAYTFSLIGLLPGTVLFCFVGASAGSLTESEMSVDGSLTIVSIVVGIVVGILAIFVVSYYAKKEFNKIIVQEKESHAHQTHQEGQRVEEESGEDAFRVSENGDIEAVASVSIDQVFETHEIIPV